jgi:hypothetical protein
VLEKDDMPSILQATRKSMNSVINYAIVGPKQRFVFDRVKHISSCMNRPSSFKLKELEEHSLEHDLLFFQVWL